MQTSISQRFSLSLIFYFFYNVDLLKIINKLDIAAFDLRFVDDVNILAYEMSIENNCKLLKIIHRACEKWAVRHEIVFALIKYELIHLTRNLKRFDMTITINIDFITIILKIDIRTLRLQIDIKLRWESHVRKIPKKMISQFMILSKISISTWDVIFARIRQIYTTMIRSTIIYEFVVWHILKKVKNVKTSINKFIIMQNKCLRTIIKAFKIILISMLEAEIYIFFIDAHFDQLQTSIKIRLRFEKLQRLIANSCRTIINKLRDRMKRRRDRNSISSEKKHSWMKKILQNQTLLRQSILIFFWIDLQSTDHARKEVFNMITRACQFVIKTKVTWV
jgi:uncharacterized membrane protein (DUF485 family)